VPRIPLNPKSPWVASPPKNRPVSLAESARALWAPNTPESTKQFFPGVAFSKDPKVLDQYFRNQYVEFNAPNNVEIESAALAVLLEELYKEHVKG
jgi:hypothetical protein